jgi:hypothetical protein
VVRLKNALRCPIWLALTCALSAPVGAQQASGIAGAVNDASGAVLPGVTVEASSPALIDKARSVVTGGDGRYNIVDLRPGTYTVTFTLAGFNTFRREAIVLPVGFTATVNAEMQVGAIEETVTVTGGSPLVDMQNVRQQEVLSSNLLETLPTGVKGTAMLSKLVPGLQERGADVGAASGLYISNYFAGDTYHGNYGMKLTYDGMQVNNLTGTGGSTSYAVNLATVQETSVETSGASAESDANNVRVNLVPKEGGNIYTTDISGLYTNNNFQSSNLGDALRSRGVTNLNGLLNLHDVNATLGGPIKRDRLWFFTAARFAANANQVAGIYVNETQGTPFYTPDLNRQAYRESSITSEAVRLTWQAAPKQKVSVFTDIQSFNVRGVGSNVAPEAQTRWDFWPSTLLQASWSSPVTNKLLIEAGASATIQPLSSNLSQTTDDFGFVVSPNDISTVELSTGFRYNAAASYYSHNVQNRYIERFAVSYVTGAHAFKTGFQLQQAVSSTDSEINQNLQYSFLNRVPNSITQFATPYTVTNRVKADLGVFVQDRWTLNRLALNMGLRLDYFNGYVPAESVPATPSGWVPARNFAAVTCVPCWTDLNPRLGASYDLFGNGRTALKASLARYVGQMNTQVAAANNPITTSVTSVTRTWNDANGNDVPDCNLGAFSANGECGPISNKNFGMNNPLATRYADDIIRGFGVRDYLWDFTTDLQHQLGSRMSVTAGYDHNWTDNPAQLFDPTAVIGAWSTGVTNNLDVTPADYSPYCVTAPLDPRLPHGGGYQVCGLYDLSPAKFGQVNNVVESQNNFGKRTRVSDFFSGSVESQAGSRLGLGGSVSTGRTVEDNCFVVNSPQQLLNCHLVIPFKAQTLVKVHASYPFPGKLVASGVLQNVSGISYGANWNAPNSAIAPSLGRNLAACGTQAVCAATATVPLIPYMTVFDPRRTQLDLRLSRLFSVGSTKLRLRADLDVYNVTNSSAILYANQTYGPQWKQPIGSSVVQGFVDGRLVQLSGRLLW